MSIVKSVPNINSAFQLEKTIKLNARKSYLYFYKAYKITLVRSRNDIVESKTWLMGSWWAIRRATGGVTTSTIQEMLDYIDED
jgi:hypothetical protein